MPDRGGTFLASESSYPVEGDVIAENTTAIAARYLKLTDFYTFKCLLGLPKF
jgi:hypothetical protein